MVVYPSSSSKLINHFLSFEVEDDVSEDLDFFFSGVLNLSMSTISNVQHQSTRIIQPLLLEKPWDETNNEYQIQMTKL